MTKTSVSPDDLMEMLSTHFTSRCCCTLSQRNVLFRQSNNYRSCLNNTFPLGFMIEPSLCYGTPDLGVQFPTIISVLLHSFEKLCLRLYCNQMLLSHFSLYVITVWVTVACSHIVSQSLCFMPPDSKGENDISALMFCSALTHVCIIQLVMLKCEQKSAQSCCHTRIVSPSLVCSGK